LFSIKDNQFVKVLGQDGDWFLIEWVVEQPSETLQGNNIKPKMPLYDFGGHNYGSTIESVQIEGAQPSPKGTRGNIRGYTHKQNIKKMKITIAKGVKPRLGYYLIPQLLDQSNKTYSLSSVWYSPPFPADLKLESQDSGYYFHIGNLREGALDFKVSQNGTVDDWYCFKEKCVSEVRVPDSNNIIVVYGGQEFSFINVDDFKSTDGPCDLDPCDEEPAGQNQSDTKH
jgi:hypothetical protein